MVRRPPGYEGDNWRGQAGENRCQLRELIRKHCPRGEFGYLPTDIDLIIWDESSESGAIHVTIIEKKINGKSAEYWQRKIYDGLSSLIERGSKYISINGKRVVFHGWHKVEVPDNEDYTKWNYVKYDGYDLSLEKFIEIINHSQSEPVEGGWKVS